MSSLLAGALRLTGDMRDVLDRRRLIESPEFAVPRRASFDVLVYFADRPKNFYQVQQWLAPLEELAKTHSTAIVCTRADTARLVRERTLLPIVLLDGAGRDARLARTQQPKVVLYLNHNNLNFRPLRFVRPLHAFISHGESDKIFMSSNLLKAFDFNFVAGQAAKDRLASNLFDYDVEARAIAIGRPQLDWPSRAPELPDDDRRVVLYAPTWEGYRPTMRYSSVVSHGESIVEGLVRDARYRVIYRPHPLTGTVLAAFRHADQRIRDLVAAANDSDQAACHLVDESSFGWQLQSADMMISDISAVAYDWLATAKPQVLTLPVDESASTDNTVLLSRLPKLDVRNAPTIVDVVDSFLDDSGVHEQMILISNYYYGDSARGTATRKFIDAIDRLAGYYDQQPSGDSGHTARLETAVGDATRRIADKLVEHTSGQRTISRQGPALDSTTAQFVVNFHATDDRGLETMAARLPALEQLHRERGIAFMVSNTRALEYVRDVCSLPCFLVYGAADPEHLVRTVGARVVLHLEQSELNFRETGIHDVAHVFIGSESGRDWLDNRLRVYDSVLVPGDDDGARIAETVRGFAGSGKVRVVGVDGRFDDAQVVDTLTRVADGVVSLRAKRDERRREIADRIAREFDADGRA
ncbi:CDP-glycerol glycerophosphotransferase family protein [Spelaeicoccus albus]|uniref:CDP-glycerol:poly(Glycerophosphate) glycerophosphotransferase n=1 Tax=Spelaeicoccus albus TaxID=1280376 RepID=A0A7Z0A8M7_9MICO|nr:CDP-glycerol glycerophosphotransferase family protein [Spelaeicoccus albus]NYI66427.1 hypothetical protein [Spelaeicoccus albus]